MSNGCKKIMKIRNGFRLPEIKTENQIQNIHKFSNESNWFENLNLNSLIFLSQLWNYSELKKQLKSLTYMIS